MQVGERTNDDNDEIDGVASGEDQVHDKEEQKQEQESESGDIKHTQPVLRPSNHKKRNKKQAQKERKLHARRIQNQEESLPEPIFEHDVEDSWAEIQAEQKRAQINKPEKTSKKKKARGANSNVAINGGSRAALPSSEALARQQTMKDVVVGAKEEVIPTAGDTECLEPSLSNFEGAELSTTQSEPVVRSEPLHEDQIARKVEDNPGASDYAASNEAHTPFNDNAQEDLEKCLQLSPQGASFDSISIAELQHDKGKAKEIISLPVESEAAAESLPEIERRNERSSLEDQWIEERRPLVSEWLANVSLHEPQGEHCQKGEGSSSIPQSPSRHSRDEAMGVVCNGVEEEGDNNDKEDIAVCDEEEKGDKEGTN